jgi:transposase InsO family protein
MDVFPFEKMCKILKVTSSGYYYWLSAPVSQKGEVRRALTAKIHTIYQASKGRFGSPRVAQELKDQGVAVSRPYVARIMRKENLLSIVRKRYRVQTTDAHHGYKVEENHLNRDFSVGGTQQRWISDLTYIRTGEGWLYLTMIMNLGDRKVIGWSMSETMAACDTTVVAWEMAIKNCPLNEALLFHSDRGIQYACEDFRALLRGLPVQQSMSRKGNCWDNSVAESFFKTLKTEMVYHHSFPTRKIARLALFEYIEGWYNTKRKHSTLNHKTPEAFAKELNKNKLAA